MTARAADLPDPLAMLALWRWARARELRLIVAVVQVMGPEAGRELVELLGVDLDAMAKAVRAELERRKAAR